MRNAAIISGIFFLLGASSFGRTINVSPDGSGEYPTIQAAVDAAADGDVIVLADGVYSGEGNCGVTVAKSLTIKSAGGRDVCSIEHIPAFPYLPPGLIIRAAGKHVAIEGLSVRNCFPGIRCAEGRATIADCVIEDNQHGGITCGLDPVTISGCVIRNNGYEGGISSSSRNLHVVECVIEGNWGGMAGGINAGGSTRISRCIIRGNSAYGSGGGVGYGGVCQINDSLIVKNKATGRGGGIHCRDGLLLLTNSVVADNQADNWGGAMYLGSSIAHLKNSVVYGNQSSDGSQIYSEARLKADHCIMPVAAPGLYTRMQGAIVLGEGVRDIDPGFVDAAGGDYRLLPDSPCIDAGSNEFGGERLTQDIAGQERVLDGDGDGEAIVDIGAYELVPAGKKVIRASAERVYFTQVGGVLDSVAQNVRVKAEGGELAFTIANNCGWLNTDLSEGTADVNGADVALTVDTAGLAPGVYTGEVTVSAAEALNGSETVMVVLYVVEEEGYWVPFHYSTIQAALDACPEGETVTVADGEYGGGIVFPERPVVLKSATGPEHCRISVGHTKNITVENAGEGARLEGFTVTGYSYSSGNAVSITASSLTIANCRMRCNAMGSGRTVTSNGSRVAFEGCTIEYNMNGIRSSGGDLTLRGCTIEHNAGPSDFPTGGVDISDTGVMEVTHCTIADNWCAGIHVSGDGTTKVSNCLIRGNRGGGISARQVRFELSDSVITGNSGWRGGGINCGNGEIRNCTISGNSTARSDSGGGGIYIAAGTLNIFDSVITENTAERRGGGIWCENNGTLVINTCTISNNTGDLGGGIWCENNCTLLIDACTISNNISGQGGGLCTSNCAVVRVDNSIVSGNVSKHSAGGVHLEVQSGREEDAVMANCVISGNSALGWAAGGVGGTGALINCTLVGNRSKRSGSGAYLDGRIVNCIVRDNVCQDASGTSLTAFSNGHLRIEYTHFPGGVQQETAYDAQTSGANNMAAYPLFARPGRWDDGGTPEDWADDVWVEGDYHLKSAAGRWHAATGLWVHDDITSPCIDAGDPASEWCGELWPHGGRINMGAYGGTRQASMSLSTFGDIADVDCDAQVGFGDFGIIASEWHNGITAQAASGADGPPWVADLDRDGIVGLGDLAVFAERWASE
ncbi:MAG: right-handed parallel beta-helix repeat-containing protein [Phycisphaerae bacterium]|nr:right-handed parallel beta-helix repeat-containing protein [Phycisphaerae bacterium]